MAANKSQNRELGPEAKHITITDLPSEMRAIAKIIGLESAIKLIFNFSGESIYIPKYKTITLNLRNMLIRREFDGTNVKALAAKYNLSTRHTRIIIQQKQGAPKRYSKE